MTSPLRTLLLSLFLNLSVMGNFDYSGLASSGVASIGNILGSMYGASTQYDNQRKLMELQYKQQLGLMKQQYQYNNAVTQMNDKRAAGLNPYAGINSAANIVSGGSASGGNAAALDMSRLGSDAVSAYSSVFPLQSEKEQRLAAAQQALSQEKLNIAAMSKTAAEAHGTKIQNQLMEDTMEDRKRLIKGEAEIAMSSWAVKEQEAALLSLQNTAQITKNEYLPRQFNQELAESAARIRLMYLQGRASVAEAKSLLASAAKASAETHGVKLNNRYLSAIQMDMIERYVKETELLREQLQAAIRDNDWGTVEKIFGTLSSATGTVAGAAVAGAGIKSIAGGVKKVTGFR